jgi:penicillin amidase
MGKGPIPLITELSLFGDRWLPWLTNILSDPESNWFNIGGGEKRDEVIRLALRNTINKLTKLLGKDIKDWKWGGLHQLTFAHPLAASNLLERLFNRGPYPIGGDGTTIWATGSNYHTVESGNVVGPPYRMIVDLGDINNSISLLSPGQSGNPASRHYDDQVGAWFSGEYHPMLFSREGVEQAAQQIMRLIPK